MKIAIFGAGGVGGYFGARLQAAGEDVHFIARGANLAALRQHGLAVKSAFGDLALTAVKATDDPAAVGPVDIVLFCVKLYDTDTAAARLGPLLGPDTAVISLQNGVDSEDRLAAAIGPAHVAGGVAYISATIENPGVIAHLNRQAKLVFGELDGQPSHGQPSHGQPSPRLEKFLAACQRAGFEAAIHGDINRAIWEKFVFLAALAAATGVTRLSLGHVMADPDTKAMFRALMEEVVAVAKTQCRTLSPDVVEKSLGFGASLPPAMKASLCHDLERGNRIEVEGLLGAMVRFGAAAGVPTPTFRTIYAALKPYADGRPDLARAAKSA
jgi:2-dehydropantoate 2-reductase